MALPSRLSLDVYRIERAALDADLLVTPDTWTCGRRSAPSSWRPFKAWLDLEETQQLPKSPIGEAIRYALGQWGALTLFLSDPQLPVDDNASERALRVAALGRKNFLSVGHDEAGREPGRT